MTKKEQLEVRIIELKSMRFASVYGFGLSPENIAMEKLISFVKPKGFLEKLGEHRIFGFNNPNPSHGSPNYGYEFWISVSPEFEPEGEVRIQQFNGGLFAVTRCRGVETITETWNKLYSWVQDSKYSMVNQQCLEEHIGVFPSQSEELTLDLFLPVRE
jgi:DNA gyrase inhibitor GyrI